MLKYYMNLHILEQNVFKLHEMLRFSCRCAVFLGSNTMQCDGQVLTLQKNMFLPSSRYARFYEVVRHIATFQESSVM
jgi:hypothetical protein